MTKPKCQTKSEAAAMSNDKAQNSNEKKEWFWHFGIWFSIVIWILISEFCSFEL